MEVGKTLAIDAGRANMMSAVVVEHHGTEVAVVAVSVLPFPKPSLCRLQHHLCQALPAYSAPVQREAPAENLVYLSFAEAQAVPQADRQHHRLHHPPHHLHHRRL